MFSGTGPDGLPCPVGHTRIPVARCNNIYIFPGVGLAVTAVRPTRLTGAMMTAAAAVSGAATIRRDPHGTLLPGRAQLTDTATVVASAVTGAAVANAVAPALTDDQIDRPFGRTRWLPRRDHRRIAARGAGCVLAGAGCGGAGVPGGAGGPGERACRLLRWPAVIRWRGRRCMSGWRPMPRSGLGGLADRSSRPASRPHQMPAATEARIAGMRGDHPGWGPSRIVRELERAGVAPQMA